MEETAETKIKLNVPRTILVGLAFFTISMFWQIYDSLMPLFLRDFGMGATLRGLIMALDNVLAVVLLPFMGILSDRFPAKLRSKFGRRMPFIVTGSVLAAATFMLVNYAHNIMNLALMLASTAFVLVFMCLYRSPAVALMPDVTPRPIRSNANAVINIMGTVGGVITLILMQFLLKTEELANGELYVTGNNWVLVSIISGLMILAAIVMIIKVPRKAARLWKNTKSRTKTKNPKKPKNSPRLRCWARLRKVSLKVLSSYFCRFFSGTWLITRLPLIFRYFP